MRAVLLVLAIAGCSSGIDSNIEAARKGVLALDAEHAQRIVSWCKSWHKDGALTPAEYPSVFSIPPTTVDAHAGAIVFDWWNNSHAEEDSPHPGFVLTCSDRAVDGATRLADGLWYSDSPMHAGG